MGRGVRKPKCLQIGAASQARTASTPSQAHTDYMQSGCLTTKPWAGLAQVREGLGLQPSAGLRITGDL